METKRALAATTVVTLAVGLAAAPPLLGQGTLPAPKDTDVELTSLSKIVRAMEMGIRLERLRCRNPGEGGVKAEFLDSTYRVDGGDIETAPGGCDEFPSYPHLNNAVFRAELVRVRQQFQLPFPVAPRRMRGSFEGPVKFIENGADLLVNGRMQGVVFAGTHDVLFGPTFGSESAGPESCDEADHFEGVLTGTVDFGRYVRPRLKVGALRASIQGRGLVGPQWTFSPFQMRMDGSLEVHGPE
jgi:hypothetical protein